MIPSIDHLERRLSLSTWPVTLVNPGFSLKGGTPFTERYGPYNPAPILYTPIYGPQTPPGAGASPLGPSLAGKG